MTRDVRQGQGCGGVVFVEKNLFQLRAVRTALLMSEKEKQDWRKAPEENFRSFITETMVGSIRDVKNRVAEDRSSQVIRLLPDWLSPLPYSAESR